MTITSLARNATFALLAIGTAPTYAATLLGETLKANIVISGEDDNGSYILPVLVGPVVIGAGGYARDIPVFKQLTEDGFSTPSNQISGDVLVDVTANAISVTMNGQVQPYELETQFLGIGGSSFMITSDIDSAIGVMSGVNMDLFNSFTPHSVDFATFYLGFQPAYRLRRPRH
jgi:hypothetical protein